MAKAEGYTNISISGKKLDMSTCFNVWVGIIRAINTYAREGDIVQLGFKEFATMAGYPSKRLDKKLRSTIADALDRIQSQQLSFKTQDGEKAVFTSLILKTFYDSASDNIVFQIDPQLMELYEIDHTVLVSLPILDKFKRDEVSRTLYVYILALPPNPIPLSFARLRERLCLNMDKGSQNRSIKNSIKKLINIGFLEADL